MIHTRLAYLRSVKGATVRRRTRVGANSTIRPGVEIGELENGERK
jgi:acetyltransferase-like isoleucine patch superfamily enzyme